MAIDKLIPQYLNSDTDQKLVKSVEMTDNLNIRVSEDDAGTGGVIKNVKGTDVVSSKTPGDAFPDGENRVIGSTANEKNKEILFLVWNENSNHGIYRMDISTGKYQKLYEDSVLNFQKFSYADCAVVVNEEDNTLFYWTDNVNPPMKVNVNRLIISDYPASFYSGTNEEKLLALTVAKQPPLKAPTYNIVNNIDVDSNNIKNKIFQFAYRYKYIDGELSSLSPYSTATASISQLKDGVVDDSALEFFNQINVFVQNSSSEVEKIILFARIGNSQNFYEVEEIDNSGGTGFSTIAFKNDKINSSLSKDEENKIYDNVPQVAKTLSIANNRLMYGNYIEGYNNTKVVTESNAVYRIKPVISQIPVSLNYSTPVGSFSPSNPFTIKIDYVQLPSVFNVKSKISIDTTIVSEHLEVSKSSNYGSITVTYESTKEKETVIGDVGASVDINFNEAQLSLEAIRVRFSIDIPLGTSKSAAILLVNNAIATEVFNTTVEPKKGDVEHATIYDDTVSGVKARVWLEGKSYFKFSQPAQIGSSNLYTSELKFAGAEIYASHLTIVDGGFIGIGAAELTVDIIKSTTLKIGGLSEYNHLSPISETTDYQYYDAAVTSSSNFIIQNITGHRSFKENAKHDFGIVYFDERGRSSGVNKINSVYIDGLHNRTNTYANKIDFRITSQAPSFAKKWQLVYGMNSSYNNFLQYTVSVAMPLVKASEADNHEKIYISMSSLEGKANSYKEQTDARIEYKYEEGDKLRVIRYKEANYVYTNYEFNVLGYEYVSDPEEAPFLASPSDANEKTGWFLVVQSKDISGFSAKDVLNGNSNWDKEALIELYTPKKELEEKVYFGIDQAYDVVNGQHYGERNVTSGGSYSIEILSSSTASSSERFYINDTFIADGKSVVITAVYINIDGTYSYEYRSGPVLITLGVYNVSITNYQDAIISTNQGDVYFRVRKLRTGNPLREYSPMISGKYARNSFQYDLDFIEDKSVSDFFKSDYSSIGKPYGYIPEAKRLRRKSSITYSDAFVIDSDVLNLSSFNLSLANWTDLDIFNGAINKLVSRGDSLTAIQESKTSQLPLGRNLIEYASGDTGVTVSRNVLGVPSYYAGNYGTSSPESVVERFGIVYYVDAFAAKIIRLSADGITPISEKGMSSFFDNLFNDLLSNGKNPRIVGGFDPDNNEYIITIEPSFSSSITIGSETNNIPVNESGNMVLDSLTYSSSTVLWNTLAVNFDVFCGEWQNTGNGIVFLDQIFTSQGVIIDDELNGSTATINVVVTDSNYNFVFIAALNLATGKLTIPSVTCDGTTITIGSTSPAANGVTISYKHKKGAWSSKYSFKPTSYVSLNNELYSFKNTDSGLMWKHNVNETRNNFYGTQYNSMIESVSNYNPSMVKVFESLGVEGGGTWSGLLTNSTQSTTLGESDFDVKEGNSYAMIPRDTLISAGHQIYIGKVESITNDKITFTTPVNSLPFTLGDDLYTAVGSTLTDTTINISGITDKKTILCSSTVANINLGDNIFVQHNSRIDGDPMRDVFLKVKLTSSDTELFEVHALSLSYDRSRLHNDRVN